jgi:sarcosine oxidase subunit alpha
MSGETTPFDLGMDALVALGNPCVGRELLARPAFSEATRPRLVGVRAADGRTPFLAGSQLTLASGPDRPCGHVTSSVFSPALGEWVGLALLARASAIEGALVVARDPLRGGDVPLKVCPTVHFDPAAERMKA